MLHSYDEIYTAKAQTALAQMLRYAEEDMHIELNEFWDMFLISGVADLFGKGDYRFIVGMSGVEAAWEVVWRLTGEWPQTVPTFCLEKSPTYWTGWILAWYQWYSGQSFRRISEFLTPVQVRDMYSPYHEMDPMRFADAADGIRRRKEMTTRLRMYELRAAAEGPEQGADEDDLDAGQNTALFYGRSDGVLTRVQVVRIGLNLAMAAEKG